MNWVNDDKPLSLQANPDVVSSDKPRCGFLEEDYDMKLNFQVYSSVSGMSCEQPVNRLDMDSNMSDHQQILNTSSTAQGGGGSFKDRKLYER